MMVDIKVKIPGVERKMYFEHGITTFVGKPVNKPELELFISFGIGRIIFIIILRNN